ncbi:MAG: metallophosphoesterase [Hominimerdicola sp.]
MSTKGLITTFALMIAGGYCLVQNRQLKVTNCKISCEKLPESFVGKKIMLISDLHKKRYGDNFNNLINSCIVAEPDYIFFTGDLYSRSETDMIPKLVLMHRLKKIAPLYYIAGNHEINNMDIFESLCVKLKQMGVHVLRNRMERIYIGEEYINVYGTQIPLKYYNNKDGGYRNLPVLTAEKLEKMLGKTDKDECNFLLSHNPFFFEEYAKWGADVVFSGHCHGGVIRLPLIGGILSPERKFFPKYTKGIYEIRRNNSRSVMALTAGLGKFRLNNPSEIMICTLEK